jgi:radical SAM protein (TIGR01212 family)
LVIGTRPDCVDDQKLLYLSSLAKKAFIQIEYGVETHNDATLQEINRGHDSALSIQMIRKTHDIGINTGAHYIFGLPGESLEDMVQTGKTISQLPLDSIKFHQLQIVKGTTMEMEFLEHPDLFHAFTLESYIDFIIRFIETLNPAIVIERFTSEMPPKFLSGLNMGLIRYDEVLRRIEAELEKRNTWQGKYYA